MELNRTFELIWGRILRAFAVANGIVLLVLATMITTDVLVRWVAGRPIVGVFEFAEILLVPVIFFVLPLVQFTNRQIRVDGLSAQARGRSLAALRFLDQVLGLFLFGLLLWAGSEYWLEAWRGDYVGQGMLQIPSVIPMGFLVFGTFLMCVTLLFLLARSVAALITGRVEEYGVPEGDGDV